MNYFLLILFFLGINEQFGINGSSFLGRDLALVSAKDIIAACMSNHGIYEYI